MELREMIETAAKITGDQAHLSKVVGQHSNALTNAKAGRRGLPVSACIKLAEILDIDPMKVIAASELATEKNETKRAVFYPFVSAGRAILIALSVTAGFGATANRADAASNRFDIFNMSQNAGNALPDIQSTVINWHYVYCATQAISRIIGLVRSSFLAGLPRFGFSGL